MSLFEKLREYRNDNGLPWFTKPWDLNVFVLRSGTVGAWDDLVAVCCYDDADRPVIQRVRATGDAWEGEWLDPTHPDGTVYVLDGHYPRGYKYGKHKGRICMRQNADFNCVRWPADGTVPTIAQLEARAAAGHSFMANRGTHWHNRFSGKAPAKPLKDDSEGCTVSLYYHQHTAGMELVRLQNRYRGTDVASPTFLKRALLT